MKAFRIDKDLTVHEINVHPDEWQTSDIEWDARRIDPKHDVWFDDEGLFQPGLATANVGTIRVTLPAYIAGIKDGDIGPAEMTLDEAKALVS